MSFVTCDLDLRSHITLPFLAQSCKYPYSEKQFFVVHTLEIKSESVEATRGSCHLSYILLVRYAKVLTAGLVVQECIRIL
jgi:hypothetical protein